VSDRLDISTKHCTIERDGAVVIMTMNRPEKKDALSLRAAER
jgi:enoyl-CoA hydratase